MSATGIGGTVFVPGICCPDSRLERSFSTCPSFGQKIKDSGLCGFWCSGKVLFRTPGTYYFVLCGRLLLGSLIEWKKGSLLILHRDHRAGVARWRKVVKATIPIRFQGTLQWRSGLGGCSLLQQRPPQTTEPGSCGQQSWLQIP